MTTVKIFPAEIEKLGQEEAVAAELGDEAQKVASRVAAPSKMQISTRHGVGPRGAFAQVIMRGPGRSAVAIEFGTRKAPPLAPLRRALNGGRG